jgi:hypothetical protein
MSCMRGRPPPGLSRAADAGSGGGASTGLRATPRTPRPGVAPAPGAREVSCAGGIAVGSDAGVALASCAGGGSGRDARATWTGAGVDGACAEPGGGGVDVACRGRGGLRGGGVEGAADMTTACSSPAGDVALDVVWGADGGVDVASGSCRLRRSSRRGTKAAPADAAAARAIGPPGRSGAGAAGALALSGARVAGGPGGGVTGEAAVAPGGAGAGASGVLVESGVFRRARVRSGDVGVPVSGAVCCGGVLAAASRPGGVDAAPPAGMAGGAACGARGLVAGSRASRKRSRRRVRFDAVDGAPAATVVDAGAEAISLRVAVRAGAAGRAPPLLAGLSCSTAVACDVGAGASGPPAVARSADAGPPP